MKVVIDIPEEQYEIIKELVKKQNSICPEADSAEKIILNGTPLPKGHGDLVDRDAINYRFNSIYDEAMGCSCKPTDEYLLNKFSMCLDTAPTIIEAESEEEE